MLKSILGLTVANFIERNYEERIPINTNLAKKIR